MSVISGIWYRNGHQVDRSQLLQQAAVNARYAPDCTNILCKGAVGMLFQGFHTHDRSSLEPGPIEGALCDLASLDGRLDNHQELCEELELPDSTTGDTTLLLAAFLRWGQDCFAHLVGDWAAAIWCHSEQSLYLARDHAGTRLLYYKASENEVVWSTYPEALLLEQRPSLSTEYALRYLAGMPLADHTPYEGISTIPPAHYATWSVHSQIQIRRFWDPLAFGTIEGHPEEWYQHTFLQLFSQAVKRRASRPECSVCHLSGGMDSSAIVCVSDQLSRDGEIEGSLSTVSFYDPTEPNWDDHLYFSVVEKYRGRQGAHLPVSASSRTFERPSLDYPLPGADSRSIDRETQFERYVGDGRVRIILAGHGGDELLGGRPDPFPELADYLLDLRLPTFVTQAFAWALGTRKPLVEIAGESLRLVWECYSPLAKREVETPPWIQLSRIPLSRTSYSSLWRQRLKHAPSVLDAQDTWERLTASLPHLFHAATIRYEYCYPFLDKDLVEFLLRVPLRELRRPKRRRYMMRNALRGIVPVEVLERRRKAYVSRGPTIALQNSRERIRSIITSGWLATHGLLDPERFLEVLTTFEDETSRHWLNALTRAVELELWIGRALNLATESTIPPTPQDLYSLCSFS